MTGKQVKHVSWDKGEYVFLNTKTLKRENGDDALSSFSMPTNWSIYEEPKPKKKVTLYRYTYHCQHRGIVIQSRWSTEGWVYRQDNDPLLLVESKEIEVDDV